MFENKGLTGPGIMNIQARITLILLRNHHVRLKFDVNSQIVSNLILLPSSGLR